MEKIITKTQQAQNVLYELQKASSDKLIAISNHHAKIGKGVIFCAVAGAHFDPRTTIDKVIRSGVSAVVYDSSDGFKYKHSGNDISVIPVIGVDGLYYLQGYLADLVLGEPSKHSKILGVTGTNGKTSISWAIAQCLNKLKQVGSMIGTLGYGVLPDLTETGNTTPSAINFQQYLSELTAKKSKIISAEVTSIALEQGRVNGTNFFVQSFSNLSRDHLDYHKDFADYFACKQKMFFDLKSTHALINISDSYGFKLWQKRDGFQAKNKWALLINSVDENINTDIHKYCNEEEKLFVNKPVFLAKGKGAEKFVIYAVENNTELCQEFNSNWVGEHNLENLAIAAINLRLCGFEWQDIAKAMENLPTPSGRLQQVQIDNQTNMNLPTVYVDFAHTPDGLQKVLNALQNKRDKHQLWCVFGCGGNRDKGKRPIMGNIVLMLSDNVVVTSDNPRNEEAELIIKDIYPDNFDNKNENIYREADRLKAINYAIANAKAGDVILISGKGHEQYQEIKEVKYPFSDYQVASAALTDRKLAESG